MKMALEEKLDMREGREVEVCDEKNDVWYKGIIEETQTTKSKSGFTSVRVHKDDFATPLTQPCQNVLIRPVLLYRV